MNKYNVIDQIDTLQNLENDMFEWSRLPYEFKQRSDENCIKLHGITNMQYYELIKSKLMSGEDQPVFSESDQTIEMFADYKDSYDERVERTYNLNKHPNFAIIYPPRSVLYNYDISEEEMTKVQNTYNEYLSLPFKFKLYSDHYSLALWGYNVPQIYQIIKNGYIDNIDEETNFWNKAYCENNIIDLLIYKTQKYVSIDESYRDRWIDDSVLMKDYSKDFDSVFPKITPYFTPDEYSNLCEDLSILETLTYQEWKSELRKAIDENNEQRIIDLGWNPSVAFTEDNISFARNRQINWHKKYSPTIVDIQNIGEKVELEESSILESSRAARDLYRAKDLYPVFIVMSFTDTLFGYAERLIKNVTYSHAGLAVDSNLKEIFTFSFGKEYNGFTTESLDDYIRASKKSTISVIAIFVNEDTRNKIYSTLNELNRNKKKTRYGFGNLFNILMNRAKEYPYPENLSLVCSQFVDTILKLVEIDITNKKSNLVIPQDFQISNNPKVYKIYEGLATQYNEKKVERDIATLFYKGSVVNIKYNVPLKINFINNENANQYNNILSEMDYLLTPESILERRLPFRFNDKGDLTIDLAKSLEQQYQESHKLLESYDKSNIEGIKKELARMFYINSVIEKKIQKMKKADEEYKLLINLRARVLNDFKKYFSVVSKEEKNFDFEEYFKHTDYYNGSLTIDNTTMKYSGALIKKLLRTIGKI